MSLSHNIQRIRKLKKRSVQELADEMGVKKQSIYEWEAGKYAPSKENLDRLAKALGVEVKVFFDENLTSVQELSDNTEIPVGVNPAQAMRALLEMEKVGEYRFVPKMLLEEYELYPKADVRDRSEERKKTIAALQKLIEVYEKEIAEKDAELAELRMRVPPATAQGN